MQSLNLHAKEFRKTYDDICQINIPQLKMQRIRVIPCVFSECDFHATKLVFLELTQRQVILS